MTDFQFFDHGSVTVLVPVSGGAKDWVDEHIPEDALTWASGVVIEPRYAEDILNGIDDDGLTVTFH